MGPDNFRCGLLGTSELSRWVTGGIVCSAALLYLSQWLNLPLYPDEVAFRLLRARYLADGATAYGLLPCLSNAKPIPVVFLPFAYAMSVVDFESGWSMLRYGPIAGAMLALLVTLLVTLRRGAVGAALVTSGAFIGVVGAGLVLSRGEAPMLFLGATCVIGYGCATRSHRGILTSALYLVVSTSLAILALYVHQQALILLPIVVLLTVAIALRVRSAAVRGLAGLCIAALIAGAVGSVSASQINCPEFPGVMPAFAKMEPGGLARQEGLQGIETYLVNKLPHYADHFGFNTSYVINYLPGVDPDLRGHPLSVLNAAIKCAVVVNLVLALCVMVVLGVAGMRQALARTGSLRARLEAWLLDPSLYLCLGIAGHFSLLFYDVSTAFYRNFHIHFILVMMNAIALSCLRGRARLFPWSLGIVALALSVASAFLSRDVDRQFTQGYVGPSVRLHTDWAATAAQVRDVAGMCRIRAQDSGIIIDDLTFDGMKQNPRLIPISYIGFVLPQQGADAALAARTLRRASATAVLARCGPVKELGLTPEHEREGICCLKLPPM